jgi:hypothetical protein
MGKPPLATPTDRSDQFAHALDRPAMREVFQVLLPKQTSHSVVVKRCKAKPIMSRRSLRQRQMVVSYFLDLEIDGAKARTFELIGTLPVGPEMLAEELAEACSLARGHPMIRPFHEPSMYISEMGMAVVFVPVDGALPAMAEMTRNDCGEIVATALPECHNGTRVAHVDAELVHYKPANRSVIRMTAHLDGHVYGARELYAKIYADDQSQNFRDVRMLWDAMGDCRYLKMPEPLTYDADRKMLIMTAAEGDRSLAAWFKCVEKKLPMPEGVSMTRLDTCLGHIAEALAELHAIDVPLSRRITFEDQLERLGKDIELVREQRPELADRFETLVNGVRDLGSDEGVRLVPVHGGFRHKQTIGDDHTGISIIDWDGLVLAHPAVDAATFTRQMRKSIPDDPEAAAGLTHIEEEFRRRFLATHPDVSERELARYEAVGLLELALRCFRRPSGLDDPEGLLRRFLEEVEQIIDERGKA